MTTANDTIRAALSASLVTLTDGLAAVHQARNDARLESFNRQADLRSDYAEGYEMPSTCLYFSSIPANVHASCRALVQEREAREAEEERKLWERLNKIYGKKSPPRPNAGKLKAKAA